MAAVIVLGILGPAIKLGKCIAAPIKRQLNYLCCFSSNLQILKEEAEKLECQKVGLEMDVATAKNNARPIDPRVNPWLKQVNEIQQTNSGLEAQVTSVQGRCCLSRYSIGRKVCKTAEYMKQIREDGREIKAVSHDRPAPASMVPGRAMRKFESRTAIEEDIMAALREGQVKIVGICGMGGVGKSTLAKNVMDRVREEKLFDICVMVIVSQRIEKDKIQGEIAENLGLELKEKFLSARASVLRSRLTNGERILIVVDDIWQYIDLEEIGIQGCSILLTSRNRHVLSEMDVKLICQMETLTEEEALSFFQEKLGFYDQNCSSRFAEIAKECKCLPLALECVAGLLKHQQSHIFMLEDVLQQLKNANHEDLPQVIEHVYIPLKLSYDHLSSENAKFIFLMCCLLPEDHNIPLEDLTAYAMGLRMFEGISDLEQTRNRTYSIVQNLKSCFLLLEGEYEGYVKMHDVNRDVAIHIASKEKHFIKRGDSSIWMSPYLGQRNELSKGSPFPNLRLLLVDNSVDEEILDSGISFEGMNNLNVLSIRKNDSLSSMPQFQKNLRTLIFKSCAMESMCGVGGLVNLEILICRTCRNIKELPLERERLERLRLLGIYTCGYLQKIRKGVLSSLKKLEELEIEQSFKEWEVEDNACLSELECLSNLTCLKIEVKDFTLAAQQISLPPKIKKYDIKVGDYPWYDPGKCEKIMLLVFPVDITLGKWILEYMANAEFLYLEGNVSNCLDLGKAQDIRYLRIEKCSTISSIAFPHLLESIQLERLDNLEEIICDAPNSNLSSVIISSCDRLQNLFPLSTAKDCFPQLQHLRISSCDIMEKVFVYENEKNIDIGHGSQHATAITFPKLKTLRLENLPRLKVSYQGIESIDFPMLTEIRIKKCPQLNASFGGDDNSLQLLCKENVSIFDNYLREITPLSTQILIGSFTQLEDLRIEDLGNLKSLFSFSMAQNLDRLDCLSISRCTEMVQVIAVNECLHEKEVLFPHLRLLFLYELPKLKSFCNSRCGLEDKNYGKKIIGQSSRTHMAFPRLDYMILQHLPELINLYDGFESTDISLLTALDLIRCPKLEGLLSTTTSGEINRQVVGISFPIDNFTRLEKLCIEGFDKISSLFSTSISPILINLKKLKIVRCKNLVKVMEEEVDESHGKTLVFPCLEELYLIGLPKLKIFCEWWCALELLSLEKIEIDSCPEIERFSLGSLSTPILKTLVIKHVDFLIRGDLNDALQQYFFGQRDKAILSEDQEETDEIEVVEEEAT